MPHTERTIYKTQIFANSRSVELPPGAKPLTVQLQHGEPCIWWEVLIDLEKPQPFVAYPIWIIGTGQLIPPNATVYCGTFQIIEHDLVFHIYTGVPK